MSPNASDEVIRMAYKALVKKYHPDSCKEDLGEAQKIMADINQAYEVLSDREKRAAYDEMISISLHSSVDEDAVSEQIQVAATSYRQNPFPKKGIPCAGCFPKWPEELKVFLKPFWEL
nr:DnaJ domain-containing protein [uncultured Acetatifactor sp.]